ncbi:TRAP transporter small permease subunit [Halovulum dunhuangense]|uniref:TRAP transporter small permease protein n=1 Tax=Halovulum dunhuangense TaxID=1505036 RepID=A0A849L6J2_9RHOB|nr:TRAP transporter small permease subunit [Halovulum dunhuangense]NNU82049.1 TRAP transporter small permease subunit [Halovulum dunhuangense]
MTRTHDSGQQPKATVEQGNLLDNQMPEFPILTPLARLYGFAGAAVVLGLLIIVNVDVFGRFLFNRPLAGTLELSEMGIVAIVFLQLAGTIGARRLTRSDGFLGFVERRRSVLALYMRAIFNILGAVTLLVVAYGQFPRLITSYVRGYYKGNVGIFTAPTWPLDAIVLTGVVLGAVMFVALAGVNVKKIINEKRRIAE